MRARMLAVGVFAVCGSCSLVVADRTEPYEGACAGQEEATSITYRVGLRDLTVTEIARDCRGCPTEDCVETCIRADTVNAISTECAACYADAADCTARLCADDCERDRVDRRACEDCACDEGCAAELNACAGIVITSCQ